MDEWKRYDDAVIHTSTYCDDFVCLFLFFGWLLLHLCAFYVRVDTVMGGIKYSVVCIQPSKASSIRTQTLTLKCFENNLVR